MTTPTTPPTTPPATQITPVAAGILLQPDGRFLLASRPEGKPYPGWWEFPGGKLEAGEQPMEALCRELHEEMGITVQAATPWVQQTFRYPHATVCLYFFRVTCWQGEPQAREGQQFAWQQPGHLSVEPILPANGPLLRGLQLPAALAISQVSVLGESTWLARLDKALARGLRWLVLREPQMSPEEFTRLAAQVQPRLAAVGGKLLLHDDPARVQALGADGVHLNSASLMACRERPQGWCGASVHDAAELAQASALGLDYAVLGSVLATPSHPGAATLGWEGFGRLLAQGWPLPVYALGGMQAADITTAQALGGQGVAMLRAAWAEDDALPQPNDRAAPV